MAIRSSQRTGKLRYAWVAAALWMALSLQVAGCSTSGPSHSENPTPDEAIVLGFVQVEPRGPYFRMHQADARVRFFDVKNTSTGETTRIPMTEKSERFVTKLSPGQYELFRVQIGEGPFRSEAHVEMNFDVIQKKMNFLGVWRLRVDPPKTVRMLQWEVVAETELLDPVQVLRPVLEENPLELSLPTPLRNDLRLFAVAPSQPRSKYFYRR